MSYLLKILLTVVIVVAFFSVIAAYLPNFITTNLNDAVIYFLSYINYLQPLVNVTTIFICLKIIANTLFGVTILYTFKWVLGFFI